MAKSFQEILYEIEEVLVREKLCVSEARQLFELIEENYSVQPYIFTIGDAHGETKEDSPGRMYFSKTEETLHQPKN